MCFGKRFPGNGLVTENLLVLGKDQKRKADLYSWNVQLCLTNTEKRRKHFCGTKYSEWISSQPTLHPGLHCGTTSCPVLTCLTETSPFSSKQGSAVTAIAALTLQRAPRERYQGTRAAGVCVCPGAAEGSAWLGSAGLQAGCRFQNWGRAALAQGHIPFTHYFHFTLEFLQSLA